ncbi:NGG1p interacting factor NIF3 [Patescibacteria group bacterium]|nr:NGG1p interacting factor NIF3 [Patescibacteria group bacterium]
MKVQEIFDLALKMGIKADPRGEKGVREYLDRVKKEYEEMKPNDKKYFNKKSLENPYSDSHIHATSGKEEVKRVMAGIDIDASEILVASQLGERGKPVDLMIAHHPVGASLASLHVVMDMQVDMFVKAGVPVHIAEKIMEERIKEVGRGVHPANHDRVIDVAKLLKVNLINTHTMTDNLVTEFLNKHLAKRKPKTIGDLLDVLLEIPEYQEAKKKGSGPKLFSGSPKHRVGKYLVEMTGGTNPSEKIYKELSQFGISTIVGMHMRDVGREKATEHHMNVVIAGHMASDSLGMNLFLDELENRGVDIVPCSGLIRVSRNKKK